MNCIKCVRSVSSFVLLLLVTVSFQALAGPAKTNRYADDIPRITKETPILFMPFNDNNLLNNKDKSDLLGAVKAKFTELGFTVNYMESFGDDQASKEALDTYMIISGEFVARTDETLKFSKGVIQALGVKEGGIVVIPSIVQRMAKLKGKTANWDGVRHTLRMRGGSGFGQWSGQQHVYSLEFEVYDAEGNWLMDSYGGVALPVVANVRTREFEPKEYLFEHKKDKKAMQRGIDKITYPFRKLFKFKR